MTRTKITFILMKSNKNHIGKLYAMTHQGTKVISRKSMQIDVPYKFWDKQKRKVKDSYPEANRINSLIEKKNKEFEIANNNIPTGNDEQCALMYMKKHIEDSTIVTSSKNKYRIILKNFEKVIYSTLKMNSLPFKMLRNIPFLEILKKEIRKNGKKEGAFKTNKGWHDYMTVFGSFVELWNAYSGTQFPINIRPFTTKIGKDDKKLATTLSHQELQKLIEYTPPKKRSQHPQLLSKNIFLFQYHTGGIRIQDALILTNKDIMNDGFLIKIKKTKESEKFPFCFEQVACLKDYYSFEYNASVNSTNIGSLNLNPSTIIQLNRLEGIGNLNEMKLADFEKLISAVIKQSENNKDLLELIQPLQIVEEKLKYEISVHFFELIKRRPQNFLFPKLEWNKFKDVITSSGNRYFNETHEYTIQLARAGHISNLKRIAKTLDIPKITGHTPRHTLANHLYSEGYSIEQIQRVLIHSNSNTTKIYIRKRHQAEIVNKTISESTSIFRKKRSDLNKGK